jgi:RNA polymerase sigma-70 factor (ECF subfamily)
LSRICSSNFGKKNPGRTYSRAYLFACIHNQSLNYQKKHKDFLEVENFEKGIFSEDFSHEEEIVEEFEKLKSLFKALDKLPPKTLKVLKKVYFEEKQYSQVAKEMGLSINTIKAHMYLAIKMLKKSLLIGWLFILDYFYSI